MMSDSAKAPLRHKPCDTPLEFVERTVRTAPEDKGWPDDRTLLVPRCPACNQLVSLDDLKLNVLDALP